MCNFVNTAIITGASRGIGRATAEAFASNNYNVLINYNKSKIEALDLFNSLNSKGLNVRIFKADVSNRIEVDAMMEYCFIEFGRIGFQNIYKNNYFLYAS